MNEFSLKEVVVRYQDRAILGPVSFDIPKGRITTWVGPSGTGKTTLLSTLNRMSDERETLVVEGSIRCCEMDLLDRDMDVAALRLRVGMIFQKPNPFPFSIRKNLEIPLTEHGVYTRSEVSDRVERALIQTGLWDEVCNRLEDPAFKLSGGQQQRLCLARALILDPEVLLLDEPCSSLDPISTAKIEELLLSLRGKKTVVLVTHQLAQARRLSDRIVFFWPLEGRGQLLECADACTFFEMPKNPISKAYVSGAMG